MADWLIDPGVMKSLAAAVALALGIEGGALGLGSGGGRRLLLGIGVGHALPLGTGAGHAPAGAEALDQVGRDAGFGERAVINLQTEDYPDGAVPGDRVEIEINDGAGRIVSIEARAGMQIGDGV